MNLFARKDLRAMLAETEGEHGGLKRTLGPVNLVTLGIGAIIGTGIFVLTGPAAALYAGPAVVLSFVVAAIASAFAGLCYAEFASLIPIAGSAYSYGYTSLGEIVAWIIGWALILEYAFGAATVAVGWSGYINSFLQGIGINIPPAISGAPGTEMVFSGGKWMPVMSLPLTAHAINLPHALARFDLVAFFGILLVTVVLVIGIQESANINTAIVIIKVAVLLVFIGIALIFLSGSHFQHAVANWHPF
ncbi:MAG: amino acid permease, partial [Terriglobales bacterium]